MIPQNHPLDSLKTLFFIGALILSRLLFRAHLRDEPY